MKIDRMRKYNRDKGPRVTIDWQVQSASLREIHEAINKSIQQMATAMSVPVWMLKRDGDTT